MLICRNGPSHFLDEMLVISVAVYVLVLRLGERRGGDACKGGKDRSKPDESISGDMPHRRGR